MSYKNALLLQHLCYSKRNVAKSQLSFPSSFPRKTCVFPCISTTQQLQKVSIIHKRHSKYRLVYYLFNALSPSPLTTAVFFRSVCMAWFSGFVSILTPVVIPKAPSTALPVFIPRDIGIRLSPDRADGTSTMGCCWVTERKGTGRNSCLS